MSRYGLIGPAYSSQSIIADCQTCKNFYVEQVESGVGKSAYVLYSTPGKKLFVALPGAQVRGDIEINGRAFAVADGVFHEILANGTFNPIGNVANDNLPASMCASPQQVLIASGGVLYVYYLQAVTSFGAASPTPAGTFAQVQPNTFVGPISLVGFSDGFFIALVKSSAQLYTSSLFDASNWTNPIVNTIIVSVFSDNVQSMLVNQRRIFLLGRKQGTAYYDSGSSQVFDVDPSATIESGSIAVYGMVRADNSVFWIDQDERGGGVARRANGYTPTRVSNHAVEFAWQGYPTLSDAVGYSYQDQGHTFVIWNFPTAQKTWCYDVENGFWHERGFWNTAEAKYTIDHAQNHIFAFGKHLVGDPTSGNIYQTSIGFYDDAGNPIRRERRAPVIAKELERIFIDEVSFDMETGLGPEPPLLDGQGNARDPQMIMRWSTTNGRTWSNEYQINCGQSGQFKRRAKKTRLGSSKFGMVIELAVSDPVPWRIVEGYVSGTGFAPQPRIAKQYAQAS